MAKSPDTFVAMKEIEKEQILVNAVLNRNQLKALIDILEPYSREWRGQYQSMMKGFVEAYQDFLDEG